MICSAFSVIKRRSDFLVQVSVHNLSFLLLVALAHVTDVVGKFCFDTVNFEFCLPCGFETGHHGVDGAKDNR